MPRIITVTSGKSSVGKTHVSLNLALHLSDLGYKTCLFDADFGLSNVNVLLRIFPELNIKDVVVGNQKIENIIIRNYEGIDIIPGSSGIEEMAKIKPERIPQIAKAFSTLDDYDFIVVDTASGTTREVISFCLAGSEVLLVITPEPTSLTDAHALLKVLKTNGYKNQVKVIVNQSSNARIAEKSFAKLASTSERFLSIKLSFLGTVSNDPIVLESDEKNKPFIHLHPNAPPSKHIKKIGSQIVKMKDCGMEKEEMGIFWETCLTFFTTNLETTQKKADVEKETEQIVEKKGEENRFVEEQNEQIVAESKKLQEMRQTHVKAKLPHHMSKEKLIRQTHFMLNQVIENLSLAADELKSIRGLIEDDN